MSELNPNDSNYNQDDEISLKELILKVKEYYRTIISSWYILLLFLVPMVGVMIYQYMSTPLTFKAKYTFMINEDEGGGVNPVSSILGSLGFGGGSKSTFNLDKILELSTSREIVQKALFEKVTIDGTDNFFANHFIERFEYEKDWESKGKKLNGFRFEHSKVDSFTIKENGVLKYIYKKIKGSKDAGIEGLYNTKYGKETGIMEMELETTDEDVSVLFTRMLYDKLSKFYVEKSMEKSLSTYQTLSNKVDSLKGAIQSTEFALARFEDKNRGLRTSTGSLQRDRLQRNLAILGIAYGKAIENLEISAFGLENSTPFFQEIDRPIYPLVAKGPSLVKNILIGVLVGLFLGVLFIIVRKLIRDAMGVD